MGLFTRPLRAEAGFQLYEVVRRRDGGVLSRSYRILPPGQRRPKILESLREAEDAFDLAIITTLIARP